MKKILIIASSDNNDNYIKACEKTGFDVTVSREFVPSATFDGLLVPGGNDIDPSFYNEENKGSVGIEKETDLIQFKEVDEFVKNGKPIFGTCRGLQLLNVYFNGSLKQDIPNHRIENNGKHETIMDSSFEFSSHFEKNMLTNSTHHQCIDKLGNGFTIFERALDGTIEGIYNKEKRIIAVQWHPERMYEEGGNIIYQIFDQLI